MSRRALSASLVAVAIMALTGTGRADDLQSLLNETIITTASKSTERGSTAPAVSSILTAEDIRAYGMHSIDEAIDFLSLGAMTSSPLRTVDIGARGVLLANDQGNHFLLLVDGHAVNEQLYGAARFDRGAGIPLELVDHIEVVLGPGSVLYGSNAMLGVINVVTKHPRAFAGTHVVAEYEIGKSWRMAAGAGYEPKIFGQRSEVTLELEYYRQNGPAFTVGPQDYGNDWATGDPWSFKRGGPGGPWGGTASHSYYSEVPSGLLTLRLGDFELRFHASTFKRATPFNHLFTQADTDFDDPRNYELDRSAWADLKYHFRLSSKIDMTTRLYADTFDYQRYMDISAKAQCTFSDVVTCRDRALGASRWIGAEVQASTDWLQDGSLVTLLGFDGRIRRLAAVDDRFNYDTGAALQSSTGVIDERDAVLGVYLQQTWEPVRRVRLNAGGRFDLDEHFGNKFSPRAALSVQPWNSGTLKTTYSEAFRAPSWFEAASSGQRQIPAQHLQPETVRSIEASIDQNLGTHHLVFGVFRSWWYDLVELHLLPLEEVVAAQRQGLLDINTRTAAQYRNVSSIDNYGFNAGYDGSFAQGKVRYGVNVTGAIGRRLEPPMPATPLAVSPQFFGNARVSYAPAEGWPIFAVGGHFMARRPADRAFDAGWQPPPYAPASLDLRGTLSGPVGWVPGLSYRGTVDYQFATHGAYVVGPFQRPVADGNGTSTDHFELNPIDPFRVTIGLQYDFGSPK